MAKEKQLSTEEVARIREKRLIRQVRFQLYAYSDHYRRNLDREGIRADGFDGIVDLPKIHPTVREDLAANPDEFVLRAGTNLIQRWGSYKQVADVFMAKLLKGVEAAEGKLDDEYGITHVLKTVGTYGTPLPVKLTRRDLAVMATHGSRTLETAGVRQEDVLLNLLDPSTQAGFWPVWLGGVAFGVEQVAPGFLDRDEAIEAARMSSASVIVAMPEDAISFFEALPDQLPSLRTLILGPGPTGAVLRRRLSERVGSHVRLLTTYGFAEGRSLWTECAEGEGQEDAGYHAWPDLEIVEGFVPRTTRVAKAGEPAEIVYTGLEQRGTALLRYMPGDVAAGGVRFGKCPYCGRITDRIIGPIRRSKNLLEIHLAGTQPVALDVEVIADLLAHPGLKAWQVEVTKAEGDPSASDEVYVLFSPASQRDAARIAVDLDREFRAEVGFSPTQFIVSDRAEGGVVDLRQVALVSGEYRTP